MNLASTFRSLFLGAIFLDRGSRASAAARSRPRQVPFRGFFFLRLGEMLSTV